MACNTFGESVKAGASSRFYVGTEMTGEESAGNHRRLLKMCL